MWGFYRPCVVCVCVCVYVHVVYTTLIVSYWGGWGGYGGGAGYYGCDEEIDAEEQHQGPPQQVCVGVC